MASSKMGLDPRGLGEKPASSGTSFDLPSVDEVLARLPGIPTSLPLRGSESLDPSKQTAMLSSIQDGLSAEPSSLEDIPNLLNQLWACGSDLLVQAAEVLANKSREPLWRASIGQSGILKFFLDVISNENRKVVVEGNYTLAILRHFVNPELIQVAIPVIYNICMDFGETSNNLLSFLLNSLLTAWKEPAHAQIAENQTAYILSKLLRDGFLDEYASLLGFSCDLIELASEQAQAVENSPDGITCLLIENASNPNLEFEHFSPLANCLATYLEKEKFQRVCISHHLVDKVLKILQGSFTIEVDLSSKEDVQAITQLRLKINQALAETSASPLFSEEYPLDSPLCQKLKTWVVADEDQLQICGCVMLGNLARSDEVCQVMVQDLKIHEELIAVLKGNSRGAVLHASLGFLKNLAIAGDNRTKLVEAGIFAISRLWEFETVPQVQFAAASIARQIIISSVDNISQLLAPSEGSDEQTYLSLLLALFEKSDSAPIKTEIGRTIASICRTAIPKAREGNPKAVTSLDRLFSLHPRVARPVGAMITQTQWPVVRSEGWFALALMANTPAGCAAVVNVFDDENTRKLLEETLSGYAPATEETEAKDLSQMEKDQDNAFVLVQELLKNEPGSLPANYRETLERMAKGYASRLQNIQNT
ncbi:hypothetical protein N7468_006394 [Penicillium chermesinum]|uniref:Uncharacterized protein n=1 Tax=Penicillium chermesinum TaxID=63820 RepID=A0A9W9TJT5_9EURO|nr:uncharacterized protein N7468_006394 [Penicillium chermesinum]KAJ5225169.1 hypothetical protein N7468_006394 [Penicillium chermesinum]